MAAVARSVMARSEARLSRLREVHENDFRPESTWLHVRAAEALILAALPLGNHLEPSPRGVAERVIVVAREQT